MVCSLQVVSDMTICYCPVLFFNRSLCENPGKPELEEQMLRKADGGDETSGDEQRKRVAEEGEER